MSASVPGWLWEWRSLRSPSFSCERRAATWTWPRSAWSCCANRKRFCCRSCGTKVRSRRSAGVSRGPPGRYVALAEEGLELLRESEALLLQVVRQQGQVSEESRQREPGRSQRIPEVVGQPFGQRTGQEWPGNFPSPEGPDRTVREAPDRDEQVSSGEDAVQRGE